jgi:hypothetical protein
MAGRWWSNWGAVGSAKTFFATLRRDPGTFRVWIRHVRAVDEALGGEAAMAYSRLVLLASNDRDIGESLATALPDLFAAVPESNRTRFFKLVRAVLEQRPDAALMVARSLPELLGTMDDAALTRFVAEGLDWYAQSPRQAEGFLRMESKSGRDAVDDAQGGVPLRRVHRALSLYARAHCGSLVSVRPGGSAAFTDGRHLYLPDRMDQFGDERDEDAYWVLTALSAGFIEFGSLDIDLDKIDGPWPASRPEEMAFDRMLRGFDNPSIARALFLIFERIRVESTVCSTYPGVKRRIDRLDGIHLGIQEYGSSAVDRALKAIDSGLRGRPCTHSVAMPIVEKYHPQKWASVADSIDAMVAVYPQIRALLADANESISVPEYGLDPDALNDEDKAVEGRAAELLRSMEGESDWEDLRNEARSEDTDGLSYAEMSDWLDKLEAPSGPMQADEDGEYGATQRVIRENVDSESGVRHARYPEWDESLGDYKPDWVRVSEYKLEAGSSDFVDDVIAEHGPMIDSLRRTFEALRPQSARLKRGLTDGESLDMDAVVAARVAQRAGAAGPAGLYRSRRLDRRDVSVAFLVDMSSSTNEHINTAGKRIIDVEREALVVTAEAVSALGDTMAIYGYSGFGREQVAFYVAKEFHEPWGAPIRERIGRMGWKLENRDGAAIRHAITKLQSAPGRERLLILLSDGKPLDGGCTLYHDVYSQEDTRMALSEARQAGIHPFCITVDPHGRSYLSQMYGDGGYTIIDSVEALPQRLPGLYRRLTR